MARDLAFDIDVDGRQGISSLDQFTREASKSMRTLSNLTKTVGAFGVAGRMWDYFVGTVRDYAKVDGAAARSVARWDNLGSEISFAIGSQAAPAFDTLSIAAKKAEGVLVEAQTAISDSLSTIFSGDAFNITRQMRRIDELKEIRRLEQLGREQAAETARIKERNEKILRPRVDQVVDLQKTLLVELQIDELAKQRKQADIERENRLERIDRIQEGLTASEMKSLEIATLRSSVERAREIRMQAIAAAEFMQQEDAFREVAQKNQVINDTRGGIDEMLEQNKLLELRLTKQDRIADRMLLEIQYRKQLEQLDAIPNENRSEDDYWRARRSIEASRERALDAFDAQGITPMSSSLRGIGGAGGELFTSAGFKQQYVSAGAGRPPGEAIAAAAEKTAENTRKQTEQNQQLIGEIKGLSDYIKNTGGLGHFKWS